MNRWIRKYQHDYSVAAFVEHDKLMSFCGHHKLISNNRTVRRWSEWDLKTTLFGSKVHEWSDVYIVLLRDYCYGSVLDSERDMFCCYFDLYSEGQPFCLNDKGVRVGSYSWEFINNKGPRAFVVGQFDPPTNENRDIISKRFDVPDAIKKIWSEMDVIDGVRKNEIAVIEMKIQNKLPPWN